MKLVINNNLHLSRMTEQRYLVTFHCTMGSCLHKTLWLAIIVTIELESCNIFCCPRVLSGHEFKYKSFLRMLVGAGLSHSLESYYESVYEKLDTEELSICPKLIAFLSLLSRNDRVNISPFFRTRRAEQLRAPPPDPDPRVFFSPGLVKASREKSMKKVARESWVGSL